MLETLTPPANQLQKLFEAKPLSASSKEFKEVKIDYGNILEVHYKTGGTDGVSLEIDKLKKFLEVQKQKKTVFTCSGDASKSEVDSEKAKQIDLLGYQSPEIQDLTNRVFAKNIDTLKLELEQKKLLEEILDKSLKIEEEVENFINKNGIGVLDIRNIFSLSLNLPATLAFYRLLQRREELIFLLHDHDFEWENEERKEKFKSRYPAIEELKNIICPPKSQSPNIIHMVLSSNAEKELRKRGIENVEVVPDSYDFSTLRLDQDPNKGAVYIKKMDEDLRNSLGVEKNVRIIGVATRAIPRKNIECTIQLISEMQKLTIEPFVLLFCQDEDSQDHTDYINKLKDYADRLGVKWKSAGNRIAQKPGVTKDGKTVYPLYDIFSFFNGTAIPSIQEGFCNNFLEAVWGMHVMPLLRHTVFETDIKKYVSNFIDLGKPDDLIPNSEYVYGKNGECLNKLPKGVCEKAAGEWLNLLINTEVYKKLAKENLESIRKVFDIQIVGAKYIEVVDKVHNAMMLKKLEKLASTSS